MRIYLLCNESVAILRFRQFRLWRTDPNDKCPFRRVGIGAYVERPNTVRRRFVTHLVEHTRIPVLAGDPINRASHQILDHIESCSVLRDYLVIRHGFLAHVHNFQLLFFVLGSIDSLFIARPNKIGLWSITKFFRVNPQTKFFYKSAFVGVITINIRCWLS